MPDPLKQGLKLSSEVRGVSASKVIRMPDPLKQELKQDNQLNKFTWQTQS